MDKSESQSNSGSTRSTIHRLFSNFDFVRFLVLGSGNVLGTSMLNVAVGWHVYLLTGSVLNLGLIGLAQFLPIFFLFPVAGLAADRFDRRFIVALCSALDGLGALGIGLLLLADVDSVWPLYALLIFHGAARAFAQPARQAILPNLVPRDIFSNAIALSVSVAKVGQLAGPALGGVLIALIDKQTYFVSASLFGVAMIAAYFIKTPLRVTGQEPFTVGMFLGGFKHIWREKVVLSSISIDLVAVLFGGVMGLLPVFAVDILQVGPEWLGAMRATPALGAVFIALLLARIGLPWPVGATFFISLIIFATSILVFSLSTSLWLSLGALAIYGASDMISVYVRQTLVQLKTPDSLRGRVSAVNSVSINASNELGDFRAGSMAALLGTVPAVAIGAGMTLLATMLWWKWFPQLRALRQI
ncbi:MAG: MFS transporter [Rhizobiaceae bacterium]